jgi:hypothetical protein
MSKLIGLGVKRSNMHGIICLDFATNIHCMLNKWRLFDAEGTAGVIKSNMRFLKYFRGTPKIIEENS